MHRYLITAILALSTWSEAVAAAQQPPRSAAAYQWRLTAEARRTWGLAAPIAVMAAQVHQESAWRDDAVSPVGALGLTQFMPGTADWISDLYPRDLGENKPMNPAWALRAMVMYNKWLYDRVPRANNECDLWWFTLRSYNGGLGHLRNEARLSTSLRRESVDAQCGKATRGRRHCIENLSYPRRIIDVHQPRYLSWGRGVECALYGSPR